MKHESYEYLLRMTISRFDLSKMLYGQTNPMNQRRLPVKPVTNVKSRLSTTSSILKHQTSDHVPSLKAHHQPLSNSTIRPQRSIVNMTFQQVIMQRFVNQHNNH